MIRDSTGNVIADAINISKFYGDVAYAKADAVQAEVYWWVKTQV